MPAAPLALVFLVASSLGAHAMNLRSPDFEDGGKIPLAQVHAQCGGQNRSPALYWSGTPAGTRSLAVTLFDPDAGSGSGFWHWLVFDIPATANGLPEGARNGNGLPSGTEQAENDFGETGYGGACPPSGSGVHHYRFTLYALNAARLPFGTGTDGAHLSGWLQAHALASISLVGVYSR